MPHRHHCYRHHKRADELAGVEADDGITLTDSQMRQMAGYYEERDEGRSVLLRVAPNLGGGYLEIVLLDQDGEPRRISESCSPLTSIIVTAERSRRTRR